MRLRQLAILLAGAMIAVPAQADPDWQWVKANNLIDKWVVEQGVAEVSIKEGRLDAQLYKPSDLQKAYITLSGKFDQGWIVADHISADSSRGFNKFRGPLKSSRWKGEDKYSGVETITLTDGWSTIGLTRGISKKR
jgi:hypothetical protein